MAKDLQTVRTKLALTLPKQILRAAQNDSQKSSPNVILSEAKDLQMTFANTAFPVLKQILRAAQNDKRKRIIKAHSGRELSPQVTEGERVNVVTLT